MRKKTILFLISFFILIGGIFALDYFGIINIPFLKLSFFSGPSEVYEGEKADYDYAGGGDILHKDIDCEDCSADFYVDCPDILWATDFGSDSSLTYSGAAGCYSDSESFIAPYVDSDTSCTVEVSVDCPGYNDTKTKSVTIKDSCKEYTYCSGGDVYKQYKSCSTSKLEDCGSDSYTSWTRYCSGGDVYERRTCYDRGCLDGSCYEDENQEARLAETCGTNEECTNGECVTVGEPEFSVTNIDAPSSTTPDSRIRVEAKVKNTGEQEGGIRVGCGIYADKWQGTLFRFLPTMSISGDVIGYSQCCEEDKFSAETNSFSLAGGETETTVFYLTAPDKDTVIHCGDLKGESNWGDSFTISCGPFKECRKGYIGGTEEQNLEIEKKCEIRTYCKNGDVHKQYKDCSTEKIEDCGSDSCTTNKLCRNNDLYENKTCYDRGCSGGSCYEKKSTDLNMLEDCGSDSCTSWDTYCSGGDLYKKKTCYDRGCKSDLLGTKCFEDTSEEKQQVKDCGESSCGNWSSPYCSENTVMKKRTCYNRGCDSSGCYEEEKTETKNITVCKMGCYGGQCTQDRDNDGVINRGDVCPAEPGSRSNGCPNIIEKIAHTLFGWAGLSDWIMS